MGSANIFITYRLIDIRVRPQQVTQQTSIRHFTRPANVLYLIHTTQLRTQSPMHTDNLIINNGCARQTIEGIAKLFPNFDTVAATAFVVKSVYAVDSGTFVVSTEDEEVFGVLDFVGEEEADYFDGLLSAVDVVSKEKVVGL
jgi:hypothetical protein